MNDLVHYREYIPRVEIVDVQFLRRFLWCDKKPPMGQQAPPSGLLQYYNFIT